MALGPPRPRTALLRAAWLLACALTLQAISLQLVRQASFGFDWRARRRIGRAVRVRARRARSAPQPPGGLALLRSAEAAPASRKVWSRADRRHCRGEDRPMSTHTADRAPLLRLGPTRAIARRSAALRCALAVAVAAFGCAQVVAVENGAAGTIVGGALVALAAPLARGRRRALLATAGLVLASLALDDDAIALRGLAAVAPARRHRSSAPRRSGRSGDPATRRLIVPAAALLAIGLFADLARSARPPRPPPGRHAGGRGVPLSPHARCCPGATARATTRKPARGPREIVARARDGHARARSRCAPTSSTSSAPTGRAFIAYRVLAGVALVSGDPIGDERGVRRARGLPSRASPSGAAGCSASLGVSARATAAVARRRPARPLHGRRGDRRSGGLLARGPRDPQGAAVGDATRARGLHGRGACERRDRRAARGTHRRDRRALARRPQRDRILDGLRGRRRRCRARRPLRDRARRGRRAARASCTSASCPARRALSLSSMRRDRDTPNGLNEFLICRALDHAPRRGLRARLAELRRLRAAARPAGAARSALAGRAATPGPARGALPARAAALVQPEVRARVDARATRPIRASRRCRASRSRRCSPRPT